jgi:16S rRNA (guanine527-N7)-methyltransferase
LPLSLPNGLAALGFAGEQITPLAAAMERYCDELMLFNSAFDLVGAKTRDEIIANHLIDSLSATANIRKLASLAEYASGDSAIIPPITVGDIGSGAGLPGIPLAAALPEFQFVLVERMEKRCVFLENCIALLGLRNVRVENTQAERIPEHSFDVCVFRAFKPLDTRTVRMLLVLLKPHGFLAAYKAKENNIRTELEGISSIVRTYYIEKLENPFLREHKRNLLIIPAENIDKESL